jgi:protein-S-isoprenylcysteine O-methyltransferase Ste14
MLTRALLAFLALPGVVAIAVPVVWLIASSHTRLVQPFGLVLDEEPWLARTHGEEWERYARRVPRWFW